MKKSFILGGIILLLGIGLFVLNQWFLPKKEETTESPPTITEPSEEEYIYVYIYGAVKCSGVYYIPKTWILSDLVQMVGLTGEANITNMDLAKNVENGKSYYIPSYDNSTSENNGQQIEKGLVNINTATLEELEGLPGIGETLANRIIEYRRNNRFQTIEDIQKVTGIGTQIFEKIKSFITV